MLINCCVFRTVPSVVYRIGFGSIFSVQDCMIPMITFRFSGPASTVEFVTNVSTDLITIAGYSFSD